MAVHSDEQVRRLHDAVAGSVGDAVRAGAATGVREGEPLGRSATAVTLAQQEHVLQRMQQQAADAMDGVLNS